MKTFTLKGLQTIHRPASRMMDSFYAFKYKGFRTTRHTATFGIPLKSYFLNTLHISCYMIRLRHKIPISCRRRHQKYPISCNFYPSCDLFLANSLFWCPRVYVRVFQFPMTFLWKSVHSAPLPSICLRSTSRPAGWPHCSWSYPYLRSIPFHFSMSSSSKLYFKTSRVLVLTPEEKISFAKMEHGL
jgi:hypothetical protein